MNCERVQELFPEHLAESLTVSARAELDAHLAHCLTCRDEIQGLLAAWTQLASAPDQQPSPAMDARFQAMLQGYRQGLEQAQRDPAPGGFWAVLWNNLSPKPMGPPGKSRSTFLLPGAGLLGWPIQIAALLLLLATGVFIGRIDLSTSQRSSATDPNGQSLAQLREELSRTREEAALSLLKQQSPSERWRGVQRSGQLEQLDERVLSALVRALNSDPNVNVRLAVVDALQQFARSAEVRKALLASLPRQESPLVQVELISLMVDLGDRELVPVLQALLQNRGLNESVRQRAEWGLGQLS